MIDGIIFDFDGIIIDSEGAIYQSWQELFHNYGVQIDTTHWASVVGILDGERGYIRELEAQAGQRLDWESMSRVRQQRERELVTSLPLMPGVRSYLEDARRLGIKLGMASSSPREWVNGHLTRLGLIDFFDDIRTCEDVFLVKPEPELYLAVLAGLGLAPNQAIALEDSPPGVTAAKRAGLFCTAVPTELTRRLPLDHADLLLNSLADLTLGEMIQKVNGSRNGIG